MIKINYQSKLPKPFFEKSDNLLKPNNKSDTEINNIIFEMSELIKENNKIEEELRQNETNSVCQL